MCVACNGMPAGKPQKLGYDSKLGGAETKTRNAQSQGPQAPMHGQRASMNVLLVKAEAVK